MDRVALIKTAGGQKPADLVLANASVVNVFTGAIYPADVASAQGMIIGVGDHYEAAEHLDVHGMTLIPGLIEGHIHFSGT